MQSSQGHHRRKSKRVITPARREQNRAAQKLHRKRRKESQQQLKNSPPHHGLRRLEPACPEQRQSNTAGQIQCNGFWQDALVHPAELFDQSFIVNSGSSPNGRLLRTEYPDPLTQYTEDGALFGELLNNQVHHFRTSWDLTRSSESMLSCPNTTWLSTVGALPLSCNSNVSTQGTSVSSGSSCRDHTTLPAHVSSQFADPYLNTLQTAESLLISAYIANATSLGFGIDLLVPCKEECLSPFYRADVNTGTDPMDLLTEARLKAAGAPEHLQPTLPQVLYPHHAALDVIPIPVLRERVITMSVTLPHLFNNQEMKVDVFYHRALTCWRYDGRETGQGGSFQPWDMRSWEAARWFLQKWRLVVDGEKGELWEQSERWRAQRSGTLSVG
ncbi:uncharacterized protein JN550_013505 [Neoarthrinium moseri]|uniref:uncharacterized protein n=1 Tax=Neoarthrinium moseri TaxID=1658444 RepID=UPI001FDB5EE4|nr:uncharacterized protein JN550_013505 [Neoarthrinium moseri]KAI1857012.1 hypothetical protein JN550_013505 [Neoarthrinium moseri]